jgi:hypothetical protein
MIGGNLFMELGYGDFGEMKNVAAGWARSRAA